MPGIHLTDKRLTKLDQLKIKSGKRQEERKHHSIDGYKVSYSVLVMKTIRNEVIQK